MITVVQGKVCAKNHPDRLSRLATIHQRYRQTDRRTDGFPVAMAWPNGRPKTTHRWQTNDPCHKAKTIRVAVSFGILRKRLLLQLASLLPQNKYHRRTSKRWRYVKINFYHLLTTTNAFITSCVASFVTSYVNTATDKGVLFLRIDEAFYANFKSLKLIAQFDRSLQDRQAWFK